jgi:hypothetical protein
VLILLENYIFDFRELNPYPKQFPTGKLTKISIKLKTYGFFTLFKIMERIKPLSKSY